jgi:hypothetical protein
MAQSIEFFLHPPSPKSSPINSNKLIPHRINTEKTILPPVSSLLPSPSSSIASNSNELPVLLSPTLSTHSSLIQQSSPLLEAVEPCYLNNSNNSPSLSPFMSSLTLDSPTHLSPLNSPFSTTFNLLIPPPTNTRSRSRSRSRSISSTCSSVPSLLSLGGGVSDNNSNIGDPHIQQQVEQAVTNKEITTKRKRGRPPNVPNYNNNNNNQQRDNWTFVTPTVWDVHHHDIQEQAEEQQAENNDNDDGEQENSNMVLQWPNTTSNNKKEEEQGQNTFTNTNMDTTLSMPKKKRGRKPKVQLAGNFCFVWRDLTAPRTSNSSKKKTKK